MVNSFVSELSDLLETEVLSRRPLSGYTSFKIGGPADLFVEVSTTAALMLAVNWAFSREIAYTVIGSGTNLLVSDEGVRGLVIRNMADGLRLEKNNVIAESGALTNHVVDLAVARGLAGTEFLAGIPGTIGGAIVGNAGAFGSSISDILKWALVLEPGGIPVQRNTDWFQFAYRESVLKGGIEAVIIEACFALEPGDQDELKKQKEKNIQFRKDRHPQDLPCAGSFFKNLDPPETGAHRIPAGLLLEQSDCHGMKVGGAAVYTKHANIIVNTGDATARDVLMLTKRMKNKVVRKFDQLLEQEVRFLGTMPDLDEEA